MNLFANMYNEFDFIKYIDYFLIIKTNNDK